MLDLNRGNFGLRRKEIADGFDLSADLREGFVRIVVQPQARGDRREALLALGLQVIDAIGRRDRALQWRSDETAHQVCAGSDVNRPHGNRGVFAAGILPNVQRLDRLKAGDHDDKTDHHRQYRSPDENVSERLHSNLRVSNNELRLRWARRDLRFGRELIIYRYFHPIA